jgi:4-hydroxybenzoyl-CoA thioesterase
MSKAVFTVVSEMDVMFGDFDPAGIVFFLNFLKWMDAISLHFFVKCGALTWCDLNKTSGIIGSPLLEVNIRFSSPTTYGERLQVRTSIQEWRRKVFIQKHVIGSGETLRCKGAKTRAFCSRQPDQSLRRPDHGLKVPSKTI